ncbi:MAG: glycine zipper domain-containing protein [Deltaproteobacteria bacterium]|nr:glycine zipper domain-containing protein [Deltaproteobacteria bacterium]
MKRKVTVILATVLFLAACAVMAAMEQRVLSGVALGAGSGVLIGAAAGSVGIGAAIGGGAGLLAGYAYDQYQKPQRTASLDLRASEKMKPSSSKSPDGEANKKKPETAPSKDISPAALHVM